MSVAVAFAASAMTGRFASMKAVGGIISTSELTWFYLSFAASEAILANGDSR
jgi:hypothetical protein